MQTKNEDVELKKTVWASYSTFVWHQVRLSRQENSLKSA